MGDGQGIGDGRDSGQPIDDTWTITKVMSSLLADTDAAGLDIAVETVNGVATLTGQVREQAQIDHAARIARATSKASPASRRPPRRWAPALTGGRFGVGRATCCRRFCVRGRAAKLADVVSRLGLGALRLRTT